MDFTPDIRVRLRELRWYVAYRASGFHSKAARRKWILAATACKKLDAEVEATRQ